MSRPRTTRRRCKKPRPRRKPLLFPTTPSCWSFCAARRFDYDPRKQSIEPETATEKPPAKWGWVWLLVGLALLYGTYTFGAVIGEKSRRPLPIVPLTAKSKAPASVKVHVTGAVNKPGVYDLPFNARIQDAIRKAGGPKPDANVNALNLADWAQDGGKIEVPARDKPAPIPTPQIIIREVPVASVPIAGPEKVPSSSSDPATTPGGIPFARTESGAASSNASTEYLTANPVNLNTATQAQLEVLPGVGPKNGRADFGLPRRKRRLQKRGRFGRSQGHRRKAHGDAQAVGQSPLGFFRHRGHGEHTEGHREDQEIHSLSRSNFDFSLCPSVCSPCPLWLQIFHFTSTAAIAASKFACAPTCAARKRSISARTFSTCVSCAVSLAM